MGCTGSRSGKAQEGEQKINEEEINKRVEEVFTKYGKAGETELTKDQLNNFVTDMKKVNQHQYRDSDFEYFYYQIDENKNGKIDRTELKHMFTKKAGKR